MTSWRYLWTQRWDGFRPRANPLYYHFYIYLADRKLKEFGNMGKNQTESHYTFRGSTIPWIEKLLQTQIDDYRKNAKPYFSALSNQY